MSSYEASSAIIAFVAFVALILAIVYISIQPSNVKIADTNGFDGSISSNNTITLKATATGILKALDDALVAATDQDITSTLITGFQQSSGPLDATDTILTAFGKLAGNGGDVTTVENKNGFAAATGPTLTLSTSVADGLVKAVSGGFQHALAQDITAQILSGLTAVSPSTIVSSDSIIGAVQKLIANLAANVASIVNTNGFKASVGPALTIQLEFSSGLLAAGTAGSLIQANSTDVTSKLLTGLATLNVPLDVTSSDSLLVSIEKLIANTKAAGMFWCQTSTATVTNTAAETSITGGTQFGTRVMAAPLAGTVYLIDMYITLNSASSNDLQILYKWNGTTFITLSWFNINFVDQVHVTSVITFRGGGVAQQFTTYIAGLTTLNQIINGPIAYTNGVDLTFTATGQWSVSDPSSVTVSQFTLTKYVLNQ